MPRDLDSTLVNASGQTNTDPLYLIRIGWSTEYRLVTYDDDVTWNSETWSASPVSVASLRPNGGGLEFPNADGEPWRDLVLGEGTRDITCKVYQRYTDMTVSPWATSAKLIFSGILDEADIGPKVRVTMIEAATARKFPPDVVDVTVFNQLHQTGDEVTFFDNSKIKVLPKFGRAFGVRR